MSIEMFKIKKEPKDFGDTESSDTEAEDPDEKEMLTIKSEVDNFDETEVIKLKTEAEDFDETVVALDTYNSDLNLVINKDCFSAKPITSFGFYYMWAGARATHGAAMGKFCFEVKILDHLRVKTLPADEPFPHLVRVGFSFESSTMQLGEGSFSFGYDGTGKIATNCKFQDFGESFKAGDVILGAVDADSEVVQIGFAKNGNFLGWACEVGEKELKGHSLFPHVLTKNVSFEVNMGQKEQPYFPLPDALKDFTFIGCLPLTQRVMGPKGPKRKEDCEVIMMCGLPGAGKTTWALEHAANNPGKKFNILGTAHILDKMTVMGLRHSRKDHGRWHFMVHKAKLCALNMCKIGSKLKRNYILDQNNTNQSKAEEMILHFDGFQRKAVVVLPSDEEYQNRIYKRKHETQILLQRGEKIPGLKATGKYIRDMKTNFRLPYVNNIFNEVIYTDLQKEDAEMLVIQYNDNEKDLYQHGCHRPRKRYLRRMFLKCLIGNTKISELYGVFTELELQEKRPNVRRPRIVNKLRTVLEKFLKANYKLSELREIFNSVKEEVETSKNKFKSTDGSRRRFDSKTNIHSSQGFPLEGDFDGGDIGGGFKGGRDGYGRNIGGIEIGRGGFTNNKRGFTRKRKFDHGISQGNSNFSNRHGESSGSKFSAGSSYSRQDMYSNFQTRVYHTTDNTREWYGGQTGSEGLQKNFNHEPDWQ